MIDQEEWMPIHGLEDRYEVSDRGRVKSHYTGRILKPGPNGCGYIQVNLYPNALGSRVHILVLEAFVGKRPKGFHAAHLNGIKNDNRLENLAWVTRSENERMKELHGTSNHGDRNGMCLAKRLTRAGLMAACIFLFVSEVVHAHSWYSGLRVPGSRMSCCNERDCAPVEHRYGAGGRDEIQVNGRWQPIDPRTLVPSASPDGEWHACVLPNSSKPRCVIQAGGAV